MAKKQTVVAVAKSGKGNGPRMGQDVYDLATKAKVGTIDAVIKTKAGKEYRLNTGDVFSDPSKYLIGRAAVVKSILG